MGILDSRGWDYGSENPAADWNVQRKYATDSQLAKSMPGYPETQQQYDKINQAEFPDYMDRFAGMMGSPQDVARGLYPGGGEGGYGPIGANELKQFGEGAYELFDQFKPGMEYIAENQGVGEQELSNMLGTSSSGYQANMQNQQQQQERAMGRMGIDPSSGAWQAGAGDRAMQGAAGLSGLQQQVRGDARQQDWSERMQAAGIGLNLAGQGTDAMGRAAGAYSDAAGNLGNMYGNYMQGITNMGNLTEDARQYNYTQGGNMANQLTGANQTYQGGLQTQYDTSKLPRMGGG